MLSESEPGIELLSAFGVLFCFWYSVFLGETFYFLILYNLESKKFLYFELFYMAGMFLNFFEYKSFEF